VTTVGGVEVIPLLDTEGELGKLAELYPEVAAHEWEPFRRHYPELFAGDSWRVPFRSFLLRSGDGHVLVDTGVGPLDGGEFLLERPGRLPRELQHHGLSLEDIELVFLTHDHVDHIGWNPHLLRARFLIHEDAWAFAEQTVETRPFVRRCVLDLRDRVELVQGEVELVPGAVAFPTPGHAPGHMSIRLGDAGFLLGDAAGHPAQLAHPDWTFVPEFDRPRAAATRRGLVPRLEGKVVVCAHYPGDGIGRVRSGLWEPL
jgi:glyoxylase-like metal-dependent hydrolase (beta-lactamase superfamily II)